MANREVNIIERTYEDPNEEIKMGAYLTRQSFFESMTHRQDDLKNIGYDWRPNLMKKSLSKYILANEDVDAVVTQYTKLLTYIVDVIQQIKKTINYAVDKKYKYIS